MRFFFYGTLIDPEILQAVLQRSVDPIRREKAVLKGYRRVYRRGTSYPVILADTSAQVEGIVVSALTTRDIMLLTMYEGEEYEIRQLPVSCLGTGLIRARVFLPGPGCEASCERDAAAIGSPRVGLHHPAHDVALVEFALSLRPRRRTHRLKKLPSLHCC